MLWCSTCCSDESGTESRVHEESEKILDEVDDMWTLY